MNVLLLPIVFPLPAVAPIKTFPVPAKLEKPASSPIKTLLLPWRLLNPALVPKNELPDPVFVEPTLLPKKEFEDPVFVEPTLLPKKEFEDPVTLPVFSPTNVLLTGALSTRDPGVPILYCVAATMMFPD